MLAVHPKLQPLGSSRETDSTRIIHGDGVEKKKGNTLRARGTRLARVYSAKDAAGKDQPAIANLHSVV